MRAMPGEEGAGLELVAALSFGVIEDLHGADEDRPAAVAIAPVEGRG